MLRHCLFAATLPVLGCGSDAADGTSTVAAATTDGSATEAPLTTSTTDDPAESTSNEPSDTGTDSAGSTETTGSVDSTSDGSSDGASTEATSTGGVEASPECVTYCEEFLPNCTPVADVEVYDDEADCLQTCAGFAHGPEGEFSGDTVECRVAHLTFDPMPGPGYYELHCFHAQEHPTSQCV